MLPFDKNSYCGLPQLYCTAETLTLRQTAFTLLIGENSARSGNYILRNGTVNRVRNTQQGSFWDQQLALIDLLRPHELCAEAQDRLVTEHYVRVRAARNPYASLNLEIDL